MALQLVDLTDEVRSQMIAEVEEDLAAGRLYLSNYLSEDGKEQYPDLLRDAVMNGSDETLATSLDRPGLFLTHYQRRKPKGGFTTAAVPHTAPVTLAEGEFNRFYLRGLCRSVVAGGGGEIEIYRGRQSAVPRASSEAMIGRTIDAEALLADLRSSVGVDTALGLPPGPNSGLTGRFVQSV